MYYNRLTITVTIESENPPGEMTRDALTDLILDEVDNDRYDLDEDRLYSDANGVMRRVD